MDCLVEHWHVNSLSELSGLDGRLVQQTYKGATGVYLEAWKGVLYFSVPSKNSLSRKEVIVAFFYFQRLIWGKCAQP